jgi:hypothetical protein
MKSSLEELLASADPLSDEALSGVLDAREENSVVDYKLDFANEDREWLEVTKDVMSFANTDGGYLVFGVRNGTYEQVGLTEPIVHLLCDPNNLMQKFNKCVEPPFIALRAKSIERDGKKFVVVLVPPSLNRTHIVSKDGAFKQQSGMPKTVLRQGTFYVRRSGANHLADARDLDATIERRIRRFRSKLLENIARVVEAPAESEVLVVKQEDGDQGPHKKFVIENAPDAIAVKGMTFSVAPETAEQEVAAWIAISKGNPNELPYAGTVWKWYEARKRLQLTPQQRIRLAVFSLLRCVPAFFWLQGCAGEDIREALAETLGRRGETESPERTLATSAFLGKRFYRAQVTKLGSYASRLGKLREFPQAGPRDYFQRVFSPKMRGGKVNRPELEEELDRIAKSAKDQWDGQPGRVDGWAAMRLDSFLYAQDEYADKKPVKQAAAAA